MAKLSYANQQFLLKPETTYGVEAGTAGADYRRMNAMRIDPQDTFEVDAFMASGQTAPSIGILNDEFAQGDIEGRADYNSILYPLASLFGAPSTVVTVAGQVFTHTFSYDAVSPFAPQSYSLNYGQRGAGNADRILGWIFNGLGLSGGRGGFDLSSSGFGRKMDEGVTLGVLGTNEVQTVTISGAPTGGTFTLTFGGQTTAAIAFDATAGAVQTALRALSSIGADNVTVGGGPGPGTPYVVTFVGQMGGQNVALMTSAHAFTGGTAPTIAVAETTAGVPVANGDVTPVPVSPLHGSIFLDSTAAALGTTRLLDIYSVDLSIGERLGRARPINALLTSDGVVEVADQEHTAELQFGVDPIERARYAKIRGGAKEFARVQFEGEQISGNPNTYRIRFDLCLLWTEAGASEDTDSVLTRSWTGRIARDSTWGYAARIEVVNALSAL